MTEQRRYQIRVQGWLGERWADWFDGVAIACEGTAGRGPVTTLTGTVVDQAALRSLLNRIWDLNLALISVEGISLDPRQERGGSDE